MNFPKLRNPSLIVVMMCAGAAAAMTPACGSGTMNSGSGSSGSGASNSVGVVGGAAATSTDCPAGNERCACYGNSTCNTGLVCASQHCVNITGLAGGSTGGSSADGIGGAGMGGAPGNNGGASADSSATGGFSNNGSLGGTSAGVTSETGGSVATGGALATGGAVATGGALAMGGAVANGGALATGGAVATGGALGTGGVSFWKTVTYSATGLPNPSNGNHNPGQNCIQCHVSGTSTEAPTWLFGGTVYKADGTTPAPNVQVGINDGTNLYTAYSATNGNFWFGGSGTIKWAQAQVRIRNSNGELTMAGATPAATCNLCHNSTTYPRITAP